MRMSNAADERERASDLAFAKRTLRRCLERLSADGDTKIDWARSGPDWELIWVADLHNEMHRKGECVAKPCRALGLSRAIYVCGGHIREHDGYWPFVHPANRIAAVVDKKLRECVEEVSAAVEEIRSASERLHQEQSALLKDRDAHNHELMCERPMRLAELGRIWLALLNSMAVELRHKSTEPTFAQPPGRGHRPCLFRDTVWQHLSRDGGFDDRQIAKLAPYDEGADYDKQKDLVRKAVDEGQVDVRWRFE
jgi:hypothetical protein